MLTLKAGYKRSNSEIAWLLLATLVAKVKDVVTKLMANLASVKSII